MLINEMDALLRPRGWKRKGSEWILSNEEAMWHMVLQSAGRGELEIYDFRLDHYMFCPAEETFVNSFVSFPGNLLKEEDRLEYAAHTVFSEPGGAHNPVENVRFIRNSFEHAILPMLEP